MKIELFKYQMGEKDFILVDDKCSLFPRTDDFKIDNEIVKELCHLGRGIGSNGLILLQSHYLNDFEITYYDENGNINSASYDAAICSVEFARYLGIGMNKFRFLNGCNTYSADTDNDSIKLEIPRVTQVSVTDNKAYFVDNITFYCIQPKNSIDNKQFWAVRKIRNGVNEITNQTGIDEALNNGTGAVASAISYFHSYFINKNFDHGEHLEIITQWEDFKVIFEYSPFCLNSRVSLLGIAKMVFRCEIDISFPAEPSRASLIPVMN